MGLWKLSNSSLPISEGVLNALTAISASTCQPIRLANIRSDERPGGLRSQHLATLSFLASLVDAEIGGVYLGSTEVDFLPSHAPESGVVSIDLEPTVDLVPLVESLLSVLTFSLAPTSVLLKGGTHIGVTSPDFLEGTLVPILQSAGVSCNVGCPKGGYGKSKGEIHLHIAPAQTRGLYLDPRGELETIDLYVATSNWNPTEVAELVSAMTQAFGGYPHRLHVRDRESTEKGAYVIACIGCRNGRAGFGTSISSAADSGMVALDLRAQFLDWLASEANVDQKLGQMMLVPAALSAEGGMWKLPQVTSEFRELAGLVSEFTKRAIEFTPDGTVKVAGLIPSDAFALRL